MSPPKPDHRFAWGVDWKNTLVSKAIFTNAYIETQVCDLNHVLSFPSDSFDYVFSNSLYWVDNIETCLSEIRRILRPSGNAQFMIALKAYMHNLTYNQFHDYRFAKTFDMGRHEHCKRYLELTDWERIFFESGFSIKEIVPCMNSKLAKMIELHDLREISPVTSQIPKLISENEFLGFKKRWVDYYFFMFKELLQDDFLMPSFDDHCYAYFVLEKK